MADQKSRDFIDNRRRMLTDVVSANGTTFSIVIGFKENEPSDYVTDGSCQSKVFGYSKRFYYNNLKAKKLWLCYLEIHHYISKVQRCDWMVVVRVRGTRGSPKWRNEAAKRN